MVALFFSYMAIDDGARIHERVGTAVGYLLRAWEASIDSEVVRFPSYTWQLVYLPFFGALGLFTVAFFWRELRPRYSRVMVVAGVSCFVAAVGLDFFEGLDPDHRLNPYTWLAAHVDIESFARIRFNQTPFDTFVHFSKVIEEVTEMFGTTLIWIAVLRHWTASFGGFRLLLVRGTNRSA